ncbi:NitT/TauT family transport system substrate-binding protein [Enhydrobacter aerosaccus]|uniref:NitT/TauT family transport system substrate-binding protein n=1 Tax=Enhydrobacter aerosaccus TaxID=225324 RepID=A0A1T4T389_9HYPH|nr:ABC transporter substrate-binding protein [Enhydrobacter aerosaccus]SKA34984.1 NitT/TauT family transport system substrate-binding protein [Enhydrobacter aerosaccus]
MKLRAVLLALAAIVSGGVAHAETITVTHWGAAFYGAPYAVARAKGYFQQQGVNVTDFLTSTGGGTSVRNTLAGDLPFGEVALPAAVDAINHGQPLKIIAGGVNSVGDILWIAKKGSPLTSIKSLIGRRVGYTSPGSVTNMLILMALKAQGIEPSQVKLVAAGGIGANLAAAMSGALDAAMTGEPTWSENIDKVQPVFWVKDVLPANMTQTVCVTTDEYLGTGATKLRGLIAARRQGVEFINSNPDEAADIVAKAYSGDAALYRRVFRNLVSIHYWSDGRFDLEGMNRMVEGLQIVGKQTGPVDWSKIVDRSLLPADLASQ